MRTGWELHAAFCWIMHRFDCIGWCLLVVAESEFRSRTGVWQNDRKSHVDLSNLVSDNAPTVAIWCIPQCTQKGLKLPLLIGWSPRHMHHVTNYLGAAEKQRPDNWQKTKFTLLRALKMFFFIKNQSIKQSSCTTTSTTIYWHVLLNGCQWRKRRRRVLKYISASIHVYFELITHFTDLSLQPSQFTYSLFIDL